MYRRMRVENYVPCLWAWTTYSKAVATEDLYSNELHCVQIKRYIVVYSILYHTFRHKNQTAIYIINIIYGCHASSWWCGFCFRNKVRQLISLCLCLLLWGGRWVIGQGPIVEWKKFWHWLEVANLRSNIFRENMRERDNMQCPFQRIPSPFWSAEVLILSHHFLLVIDTFRQSHLTSV